MSMWEDLDKRIKHLESKKVDTEQLLTGSRYGDVILRKKNGIVYADGKDEEIAHDSETENVLQSIYDNVANNSTVVVGDVFDVGGTVDVDKRIHWKGLNDRETGFSFEAGFNGPLFNWTTTTQCVCFACMKISGNDDNEIVWQTGLGDAPAAFRFIKARAIAIGNKVVDASAGSTDVFLLMKSIFQTTSQAGTYVIDCKDGDTTIYNSWAKNGEYGVVSVNGGVKAYNSTLGMRVRSGGGRSRIHNCDILSGVTDSSVPSNSLVNIWGAPESQISNCYLRYAGDATNLIGIDIGKENSKVIGNEISSGGGFLDIGVKVSDLNIVVGNNTFIGTFNTREVQPQSSLSPIHVRNNLGLNPIGVQTNKPYDDSVNLITIRSDVGENHEPSANTDYTVQSTPCRIISTGGTDVSIDITDQDGNTIESGLATCDVWLEPGWTINWGAYTGAPSTTVVFK